MISFTLSKRIAIGVLFALVCIVALLAGAPGSATGADGPVIAPAPDAAPGTPLAPILGPVAPAYWIPFYFTGEIICRRTDPIDGLDKGSILTDLGMGLTPAQPNALERAKLEMARQAVEASRTAGTLLVDLPSTVEALPSTGFAKPDAMPDVPAIPPAPDPAACVGDLRSLQVPGTGDLTPAELEKLRMVPRGTDANAPDGREGN